jgi:hypothetical protein
MDNSIRVGRETKKEVGTQKEGQRKKYLAHKKSTVEGTSYSTVENNPRCPCTRKTKGGDILTRKRQRSDPSVAAPQMLSNIKYQLKTYTSLGLNKKLEQAMNAQSNRKHFPQSI